MFTADVQVGDANDKWAASFVSVLTGTASTSARAGQHSANVKTE